MATSSQKLLPPSSWAKHKKNFDANDNRRERRAVKRRAQIEAEEGHEVGAANPREALRVCVEALQTQIDSCGISGCGACNKAKAALTLAHKFLADDSTR